MIQPARPFEESRLLLAACAIPWIGIIPRMVTMITLEPKMKKAVFERDGGKTIHLIRLTNQYFIADMIRDMITIAVIISGLELFVMYPLFTGLSLAIHAVFFGWRIGSMEEHWKSTKAIERIGMRFI